MTETLSILEKSKEFGIVSMSLGAKTGFPSPIKGVCYITMK